MLPFPDPGQTSMLIYGLERADANSNSPRPGVEGVFLKDDETHIHFSTKLFLQSNMDTSPLILLPSLEPTWACDYGQSDVV